MKIINGTAIANKILNNIKAEVLELNKKGKTFKIVCVLVGNDKSSLSFIRKKQISCEEVGIKFELKQFEERITEERLLEEVETIQNSTISGIIIQLPLPKHINKTHILSSVNPKLDVDCLVPANLGLLVSGDSKILPPAAAAVLHILKEYKINLSGKHIVIVGRGDLVGKPLAILLTHGECTITSCNRHTKNLAEMTKQADILISCAGVAKLITREMVKKGAVILDVGTNHVGGKLCGDVDFEHVKTVVNLIAPVPGGVGPVMVAKLLENVLILNK